MANSKRKRVPRTVLKLPDLEQSKSAVLNSLTSACSKRSYDQGDLGNCESEREKLRSANSRTARFEKNLCATGPPSRR
jgi:hypothetical protein